MEAAVRFVCAFATIKPTPRTNFVVVEEVPAKGVLREYVPFPPRIVTNHLPAAGTEAAATPHTPTTADDVCPTSRAYKLLLITVMFAIRN